MPAQPKNTEETARDGRGLRDGCPSYLNIIDLILEIDAIGLSLGEMQLQDELRNVESRS